MLILIENGEVYAPEPRGRQSILLANDRIARIGGIDPKGAEALGLEIEVIDASGCMVTPGFLDPHVHLIGGSGEEGFSSRTPEITLRELLLAGTTTVVGCLGVDSTTRSPGALLARVRALEEAGITAFMYTGHYGLPPSTITDSVRNDLIFIDRVLGVGEIAISDERAMQPDNRELAQVVVEAKVGGSLSGKAGVTHFHLGSLPEGLAPLRAILDDFHLSPETLYPSHVNRTERLLQEAVELSKRGVYVDMDTTEEGLDKWLRLYFEQDGDPKRLTVSSDADSISPLSHWERLRDAVEKGLPFERLLPCFTANTAAVLKLAGKGKIEPGADADLLVIRKEPLEIVDVIARGRPMVRRGEVAAEEKFVETSDRKIEINGQG